MPPIMPPPTPDLCPPPAARPRLCRIVRCAMLLAASALALACWAPATALADECPSGGSHEFEAQLVRQATAEEAGLRVFTCVKCGYSYEDAIPPTGHDWGPWIREIEPTCISEGLDYRLCRKAAHAEHREERVVAMLSATGEHAWVEWERRDPTCEETGLAQYRCTVCGREESQALDALGHDWGSWEAMPGEADGAFGREQRVCLRDAAHVQVREVAVRGEAEDAEADGDAPARVPPGSKDGVRPPAAREEVEPAARPAPEPDAAEGPREWEPNDLDRALAAGDFTALAGFSVLSYPLFRQIAWILGRRRKAGEAAEGAEAYGLLAPDAERDPERTRP